MLSTPKKKNQHKRQLSKLNETLNDFIIGNNTNFGVSENENLEQQANGRHKDFERNVDNASQNQVIGKNSGDKIRDAANSAVIVVENRLHDAILTVMNDVVIPRVEMAVRSITGSSANGVESIVQNLDRRDFTGNSKNTSLRSASGRLDLNIDQNIIDEIRDIEISEDGGYPATKLNYDRRAHTHHRFKRNFLNEDSGCKKKVFLIYVWKQWNISLNIWLTNEAMHFKLLKCVLQP